MELDATFGLVFGLLATVLTLLNFLRKLNFLKCKRFSCRCELFVALT